MEDLDPGALDDLNLTLDPLTNSRYNLAGGNPVSFVEYDGHYLVGDGGGKGSKNPKPSKATPESSTVATREEPNSFNPVGRLWGGLADFWTGRDWKDHADYIAYWAKRTNTDPRTLAALIERESGHGLFGTDAILMAHRVGDAVQVLGQQISPVRRLACHGDCSIGITNIDETSYEKLTSRHPEIEGAQADELHWSDLAHDENLAIRATAFELADFQQAIVQAHPSISYSDLQARLASTHKSGRVFNTPGDPSSGFYPLDNEYLENWFPEFSNANTFYCHSAQFSCSKAGT